MRHSLADLSTQLNGLPHSSVILVSAVSTPSSGMKRTKTAIGSLASPVTPTVSVLAARKAVQSTKDLVRFLIRFIQCFFHSNSSSDYYSISNVEIKFSLSLAVELVCLDQQAAQLCACDIGALGRGHVLVQTHGSCALFGCGLHGWGVW